jgi:hypothetical protein
MLPEDLSHIVADASGCTANERNEIVSLFAGVNQHESSNRLSTTVGVMVDELKNPPESLFSKIVHTIIVKDRDPQEIEANARSFSPNSYIIGQALVDRFVENKQMKIIYDSFHWLFIPHSIFRPGLIGNFQGKKLTFNKSDLPPGIRVAKTFSKSVPFSISNKGDLCHQNPFGAPLGNPPSRLAVAESRRNPVSFSESMIGGRNRYVGNSSFSDITGKKYDVKPFTRTNPSPGNFDKVWQGKIMQKKKPDEEKTAIKIRNQFGQVSEQKATTEYKTFVHEHRHVSKPPTSIFGKIRGFFWRVISWIFCKKRD